MDWIWPTWMTTVVEVHLPSAVITSLLPLARHVYTSNHALRFHGMHLTSVISSTVRCDLEGATVAFDAVLRFVDSTGSGHSGRRSSYG